MKTIVLMYQHLRWANEQIVEEIRMAGDVSEYVRTVMHHLLRTEQVWLTRLRGRSSSHIPIWGDSTVDDIITLLKTHENDYEQYLSELDPSRLDETIAYRTQAGLPKENTIRDILIHVALHGHYHRGQINAALRKEQHEPVPVDYIIYRRS